MALTRMWREISAVTLTSTIAASCAVRTAAPAAPRPEPFPESRTAPGNPGEASSGTTTTARARLMQTALSLQGVPYLWGGDRPEIGFDCSGFVQYVLGRHQIPAPRSTTEQFRLGKQVDLQSVRAGDLVFFSTVSPGPSHVGLAINGDEFVHAPATSGVVRVERIRAPYWKARYVGARRVF